LVKVFFTVRRLQPGGFERFREAWAPSAMPRGWRRGWVLRHPVDRDQVAALAVCDGADESFREVLEAAGDGEALVSGVYDLVHQQRGVEVRGAETMVPVTSRRLRPGSFAEYFAASRAATPELPLGLTSVMLLRSTEQPDEIVNLGLVRSDDVSRFWTEANRVRSRMLEAIEPFVEEVGIDTTYEVVDELALV
jgi:hypothetical protein